MRRPVTMKPVVLVWLGPLAPGNIGVFPALLRHRLLILLVRRTGVGRLLRCLAWRHRAIIPLTSSAVVVGHLPDPESLSARR